MLRLVSNLSAPWGRRRVDRKGSEAIVSKTYNRMRLACSRKRGELKSKRGPMRFDYCPILTLIASAWAARVIALAFIIRAFTILVKIRV